MTHDGIHIGKHSNDWSFSFGDTPPEQGATVPDAAVPAAADALEFAKATLNDQLTGAKRTALHLQSLLRRSHGEGLTIDELAVFSGLSRESVEAVVAGEPLLDLLFRTA